MILRLLGGICLLALIALPAETRADIFTVRDVRVDATAESVAAAREQGMAEGQVRAVEQLWDRLVAPEQRPLVPPLSASELSSYYIQNMSVSGERTSTSRYIANLTVQFRPDQVRQFLRSNGIAYAETRSRPVLVLPLYGPQGSAVLWAGENPWLAAWQRHNSADDLVPVVAPLGDLADLTTVDGERATSGDVEAMAAMAERYGAGDVLVSRAEASGDPVLGTASVVVTSRRYPDVHAQGGATLAGQTPAGQALAGQALAGQAASPRVTSPGMASPGMAPVELGVERLSQQPGEELDALFARAAAAVSRQIQAEWLRQNQLRFDQEAQLQAKVPVGTLGELVEVQRRLSRVAAVRDHYTLSVTRSAAEIGLVYYGDPLQLQRALSQVDLALEQRPTVMPGEPAWQLRLTRSALEIDSAPLGGSGSLTMEELPEADANAAPGPGVGDGATPGAAAGEGMPAPLATPAQ